MNPETQSAPKIGFCIYMNTFFQGPVPAVTDEQDQYVIFETELEAQKEIADNMIIRLQEFLDGERDFDDAITTEEYVVRIEVNHDRSFTDETGTCYGPKPTR